jgi:hypothetical protein
MVEPPVSYLDPTVPAVARQIGVSIGTAGCACLVRRTLSLRPPSTSCTISAGLPPSWQEKKATPDELEARAEANGYRRGEHREEDSRRDCNKHEDKTKKDQERLLVSPESPRDFRLARLRELWSSSAQAQTRPRGTGLSAPACSASTLRLSRGLSECP